MSLREKLQKEKEAKAEARLAEKSEAQEQETVGLKQELQSLLEQESALANLQERVTGATANVAESKKNLKKERGTLRQLHTESIDEETGEAMLPKPAELIRSEEYKDEEELQQYEQARGAFKESAKGAKEVAKELKALGIEDASTMLPGQIEALLKERGTALKREVEKFVLEHPDVDPERTAEVKERIITGKVERLYLGEASNSHFQYTLSEISRDGFTQGLRESLQTLTDQSRDRSFYITKLRQLIGKNVSDISEMDAQALSRAIAKQLIEGDHVWREDIQKSFAREYGESFRDVPRDKQMDFAEKLIADMSAVQDAASQILDGYKDLVTYEQIPERRGEMESRAKEIDERLRGNTFGSWGDTIESELRRLSDADTYQGQQVTSIERQLESLRSAAPRLLELKQLPQNVLDTKVKITPGSFGAPIAICFESGVNHSKEIADLYRSNEKAREEVPALRDSIARIAKMSNGMFNRIPREKREALDKLRERVKTLSGVEVEDEVEAANALKEVQEKMKVNEAKRQELVDEETAFYANGKPLEEFGVLLGEFRFEGTVQEYIEKLYEKLPKQLEAEEAERERLAGLKEESDAKRRSLEQERVKLQEEKEALARGTRELRDSEERLEHQLYTKKYIAERRSPRY